MQLLRIFGLSDKTWTCGLYHPKGWGLPSTLTVYRGVTDYNSDNSEALSWTTEKDVAEWFSKRYGQNGTVLEAQKEKEHIYAFFGGESGVIVEPR